VIAAFKSEIFVLKYYIMRYSVSEVLVEWFFNTDVILSCCRCLQLILNNRFELGYLLSKCTIVLFLELLLSSYLQNSV